MKLSYEELETKLHDTEARLHDTEARLQRTEELLKKALEEIEKLKAKLNRNSKNSSKPPSTDQKNNTCDNDTKRLKSRAGSARAPFPPDKVDRHVQCTQCSCPHCGSSFIKQSDQGAEIIQQAELPEIKATITEYQLLKYRCAECGKHSTASLPPGIPDSAFGPKLMGLLATLTGVFHLAKREAIQLIADLYEVEMSVGSVPNIEERISEALEPIYLRIHHFVIKGPECKHFDETGWRDRGKRHYVWLASCQNAAIYMIDRTRSSTAFKRLIRQEEWTSPTVTDRYGVYRSFNNHQYCLAHLIREFKGYGERDGPEKAIGKALEDELRLSCKTHKEYREGNISLLTRNRRLGHRKRKVRFCLSDGLANGSDALSKMCSTLLDNFEKLWTFTSIPGMEPTNNLAERDLRKLVIWRKKSYGTRSERGKKFVERITTVSQTLRRQKKNVLRFMQTALECLYSHSLPPLISEDMNF